MSDSPQPDTRGRLRDVPSQRGLAKSQPQWKLIRDQLEGELSQYAFGSAFYTISDICQKFSVSKITAIRVLNELAAQGLIEKRPGVGNTVRQINRQVFIRMIVPARNAREYMGYDPTNARLDAGIRAAAARLGVDFATISEAHLPGLFQDRPEPFGFIVIRTLSKASRQFLISQGLPMVYLDPFDGIKPGTLYARMDRVKAGYLATRHLLDLGHRRIAWVIGPVSHSNFRARLRGYRDALAEAGIPFRWSLVKETDGMDQPTNEAVIKELLELDRPPTAIIAGDDHRAIHILDTCRRLGVNVPQQLSVVGFPNHAESSLTDPPLTVIDAEYEKVGEATMELLIQRMCGRNDQSQKPIIINPSLVVRGSTARRASRLAQRADNRDTNAADVSDGDKTGATSLQA